MIDRLLVLLCGWRWKNSDTHHVLVGSTFHVASNKGPRTLKLTRADFWLVASILALVLAPAARAQARRTVMEALAASNNTVFVATTTGRVGISTATPATTLDVAGNAQFGRGATKSTFTATGQLFMANGASVTIPAAGMYVATATTSETPALFVNPANSRIGVQTASPAGQLDIRVAVGDGLYLKSTAGVNIWNCANGSGGRADCNFYDSGGNVTARILGDSTVYFNTGGNFGIGTSAPVTKLDVDGNAQFGTAPTKSTFTATGIFVPRALTLAQIRAYTPVTAEIWGLVVCSNCASAGSVCQSTGTTIQGFRLGTTGTTGCQ